MSTKQMIRKYGEPGSNQVYCHLPYKMRLAWDTDVSITRFSCHKLVVESAEAIFEDILSCYGRDNIRDLRLDLFGGCLNIRKVRRGSKLSLHSWGIAIDLDPLKNKLSWGKDKANFAKPEYQIFWDSVYKHGGYSLGLEKNFDFMHFQFERIS